MTQEKIIKVPNGYFMLFIFLLFLAAGIFSIVNSYIWLFIVFLFFIIIILPGFFLINPNTSKVLLLFGKYIWYGERKRFLLGKSFLPKKRYLTKSQQL